MNGHLQTIFYSIKYKAIDSDEIYPYKRTFVKLEDRGQISLDWICCPEVEQIFTKNTPILVFVPGMTGNRHCGYAKVIIKEACMKGMKCVVINHRGCSHTPVTSRISNNYIAKLYSQCSMGDIKAAINTIHNEFPENPIYGV